MFVTSDEFNVLGKRVERMEAAVANVVRKVHFDPVLGLLYRTVHAILYSSVDLTFNP